MQYKKLTQKEYINILKKRNKSLIIDSFYSNNDISECFKKMEKTIKNAEKMIKECYKNCDWIKLISGDKKRMIFKNINDNENIYSWLSGNYYLFEFAGYDFVINEEKIKENETISFNINLSLLE